MVLTNYPADATGRRKMVQNSTEPGFARRAQRPTAAKGTPGQAPTFAGWISACAEGEGAYIPGGDTTGAAENGYVRPHSSHRRLLVDRPSACFAIMAPVKPTTRTAGQTTVIAYVRTPSPCPGPGPCPFSQPLSASQCIAVHNTVGCPANAAPPSADSKGPLRPPSSRIPVAPLPSR